MPAILEINDKGFYTTPGIGGALVRIFHESGDLNLTTKLIKGRSNSLASKPGMVDKHTLDEATGAVTTTKHRVTEVAMTAGQVISVEIRRRERTPVRMTLLCEETTGKALRILILRADWEPNEQFDILAPKADSEVFSRFSRI